MTKPELARVVASSGFVNLRSGLTPNEQSTRNAGVASRLLAQLLAGNGVDGAAISPTFELGKNLSHYSSDLVGTAGDRCLHRRSKLGVAHLSRKILLERRRFG